MGAMRSIEIVEPLPLHEFLFEVHVILVRYELVEFLLVRPVRSLNLSIELRASRLDVYMPNSHVLDVPVKLGLPLVAAVGPERLDAEGELLDNVVDKVDGVFLGVAFVYFQGSYPRRVVDGSILEALDLLSP